MGSCRFDIRPIDESTRPIVTEFIREHWYGTDMLIRGAVINMTTVDGFVLMEEGALTGLLTYAVDNGECEIVSLDSTVGKRGVGSALIDLIVNLARERKCECLRLMTTNDNLNAIGFYQKRGFDMAGINLWAMDKERAQNPSIPLIGMNGIPIHHEVEFRMNLS